MKKWMCAFLFATMLGIIACVTAGADPVSQISQTFTAANGAPFTATAYGDEYFWYYATQDGTIIKQNVDFEWCYTTVEDFVYEGLPAARVVSVASRYLADPRPEGVLTVAGLSDNDALYYQRTIAQREAQPQSEIQAFHNARAANPYPYLGEQKTLVVLVSFKDVKISTTEVAWASHIFGTSGKTVYTYYNEVSKRNSGESLGQIQIKPVSETGGTANNGVVKVEIDYNFKSYNDVVSADSKSYVVAALNEVKRLGYVDIAALDKAIGSSAPDGSITGDELHIVFVLASKTTAQLAPGERQSPGALRGGFPSNTLWNGKRMTTYMVQGELSDNQIHAIGTTCHEMGHDLGLPDLYEIGQKEADLCVEERAARGVGAFSVMANSTTRLPNEYNGMTPIHLDAYCKVKLGLVEPIVMTKDQLTEANQILYPPNNAGNYSVVKVILTSLADYDPMDEYFLIENRYFKTANDSYSGFDQGMKMSVSRPGIVIYHVNPKFLESGRSPRTRVVDVEDASEALKGYSMMDRNQYPYDATYYWGTSDHNFFGPTTVPGSARMDGTATGLCISVKSVSSDAQPRITVGIRFQNSSINSSKILPFSFVSGDFNGDGKQETAAFYCSGSRMEILAWDTEEKMGSFTVQDARRVWASDRFSANVSVMTSCDMNGDGYTDIVALDQTTGILYYWWGSPSGLYAPQQQTLWAVGVLPSFGGMASGDFDNDGKDEIALMYNKNNRPTIAMLSGEISIVNSAKYMYRLTMQAVYYQSPLDFDYVVPGSLVAGNYDGNGPTDLAFAYDSTNAENLWDVQTRIVYLKASGNGGSSWLSVSSTVTLNNVDAFSLMGMIISGDFNGDGYDDAHVFYDDYSGQKPMLYCLMGSGGGLNTLTQSIRFSGHYFGSYTGSSMCGAVSACPIAYSSRSGIVLFNQTSAGMEVHCFIGYPYYNKVI